MKCDCVYLSTLHASLSNLGATSAHNVWRTLVLSDTRGPRSENNPSEAFEKAAGARFLRMPSLFTCFRAAGL